MSHSPTGVLYRFFKIVPFKSLRLHASQATRLISYSVNVYIYILDRVYACLLVHLIMQGFRLIDMFMHRQIRKDRVACCRDSYINTSSRILTCIDVTYILPLVQSSSANGTPRLSTRIIRSLHGTTPWASK